MARAKSSRKKGKARGALTIIAFMLLTSGFLRVGLEATEAIAKEASPEEMAAEAAEQTPEPQHCVADEDLVPLLQAMDQREAIIRDREEEIAVRMQALKIADEKVREKLVQLREAEQKLSATIAQVDQAAETDLARLTSVYENMKPKDAAALFEEMAPEFAAGFLGRMRPEAAAGVMAGLTPEAAYTISVILAGRNANAPKE